MIKVIVAVLVAMVLCGSAHAEEDYMKWTATDVAMQTAYTALHVLDWGQTRWIANNPYSIVIRTFSTPDGHVSPSIAHRINNEVNPLLGRHPTIAKVNVYFASTLIAHTAVSHYLPTVVKSLGGSDAAAKYSRSMWQAVTIGFEGGVTARNVRIGVRVDF